MFQDFDEFLGMMKQKANEADQQSDLRDAFKIFDRDNNGYIDMKELKQVTMPPCQARHSVCLFKYSFLLLFDYFLYIKQTYSIHSFFLDKYVYTYLNY